MGCSGLQALMAQPASESLRVCNMAQVSGIFLSSTITVQIFTLSFSIADVAALRSSLWEDVRQQQLYIVRPPFRNVLGYEDTTDTPLCAATAMLSVIVLSSIVVSVDPLEAGRSPTLITNKIALDYRRYAYTTPSDSYCGLLRLPSSSTRLDGDYSESSVY
jgi:hypothetical protein